MSIELKIPDVGESIQEVQIGRWLKQEGDSVEEDENVVELETDKASMELPAPAAGVLREIVKQDGETVAVGDVIAYLDEGNGKPKKEKEDKKRRGEKDKKRKKETAKAEAGDEKEDQDEENDKSGDDAIAATPSARRALRKHGLSAEDVEAKGERLTAADVKKHVAKLREEDEEAPEKERAKEPARKKDADVEEGEEEADEAPSQEKKADRGEDRPEPELSDLEELAPMSLIRRRIAQRLVEAQQQAALLTTFNEIDMAAVMQVRREHGKRFQQRHGVKLGIMSFFVKAAIDALKREPELNAEIRDERNILYRNYYHIGIAIGSERGLVVPVLRHAERMSFAEVEQAIDDFARRAEDNQLEPGELEGGTFTITNGGVYGSLLSTPIVNPPQTGVLGMHAIQDRPVALGGQVVIRPMMYVALTYDHRLVDGRQAVTFLRRIREAVEDPARMLIEA